MHCAPCVNDKGRAGDRNHSSTAAPPRHRRFPCPWHTVRCSGGTRGESTHLNTPACQHDTRVPRQPNPHRSHGWRLGRPTRRPSRCGARRCFGRAPSCARPTLPRVAHGRPRLACPTSVARGAQRFQPLATLAPGEHRSGRADPRSVVPVGSSVVGPWGANALCTAQTWCSVWPQPGAVPTVPSSAGAQSSLVHCPIERPCRQVKSLDIVERLSSVYLGPRAAAQQVNKPACESGDTEGVLCATPGAGLSRVPAGAALPRPRHSAVLRDSGVGHGAVIRSPVADHRSPVPDRWAIGSALRSPPQVCSVHSFTEPR